MEDPYIYPNGILKNKLNIETKAELDKAEADIGFLKLINIDSIEYDKLDEKLIKKIHNHIFEDIFDWAGEYRTVPIVKEELVLPGLSLQYSEAKNIDKDLKKLLKELELINWNIDDKKELSTLFARKMSLLWKVHPFRDGNTRTFLSFSYIFAKEKGFPFDIKLFTEGLSRIYDENERVKNYSVRDKFVLACLPDCFYPEPEHLARIFENAMISYEKSKKI